MDVDSTVRRKAMEVSKARGVLLFFIFTAPDRYG